METKRMNELYANIANKVNSIIPDEWEKIYIYGEVLEDSREVYFYFKPVEQSEYVYGHDIPKEYGVDRKVFRELMRELSLIIQELNDEYKENNDMVWTNFTFSLERSGKFDIKFNYDDVLDCGYTSGERQIIWEYEVLGIEPSDEYREMLDEYLKSKSEQ